MSYIIKTLWEIVKITKWKKVDFSDKWEKWYIDIWILRTNQIIQYTDDNWVECNENDILIAWDWSKSWTIWYWLNWIIWSTLAKLEITEKDIYTPYVWEFLKSKFDYLNTYTSWAAIPHIRKEVLVWIQIPLPPLETQKAIVAKLDQIFAELDQTKSEIQKNLDNTDELWKSTLNQSFQGDWEMKTLQDVCLQKITDWTHQTPTYCGEKEWIPFISSKDVTKEYIDREWWIKYIPQSLHEELYKRIAPQKDDVLLAKNWTTWVAAIVEDDRIFDIYVTLAVLRPNQKIITPRFLHRIVNSPICKRQFDKSLKWAGVPNLHLENIKTVTIPVPPLSEQEKIVEHLDQVSKEVKALKSQYQSQLDNLEELKKSVLDKAFRWEMEE